MRYQFTDYSLLLSLEIRIGFFKNLLLKQKYFTLSASHKSHKSFNFHLTLSNSHVEWFSEFSPNHQCTIQTEWSQYSKQFLWTSFNFSMQSHSVVDSALERKIANSLYKTVSGHLLISKINGWLLIFFEWENKLKNWIIPHHAHLMTIRDIWGLL